MQIRYGFHIELILDQPTTLVTLMDIHPSRRGDVIRETPLQSSQPVPIETFIDGYGNVSRRLTAGAGGLALTLEGIVRDSGRHDDVDESADALPPSELPADVLPFLMGSRYCENDLLSNFAWAQFGHIVGGWARVQAICDFVHDRLRFSYPEARETRTAAQAMEERTGVCRDFTHLAIALCRCMNIPARFCNGYLGDIGVPPDPAPMDFNAWFEAHLGSRWYTFDARHNQPRIGRILISRGRDAADVAMITSFGRHQLPVFTVITEELFEREATEKVTLAA
jgi:transglutaminase-like putative cysteine protease